MEEGYGAGRDRTWTLYRQRQTLDLYWQRQGGDRRRGGAAGGARLPRPAAGVRPVPPPPARRLAAGRPAQLRQLLHAASARSASRARTRRSYPEVAAVFKRLNAEAKTLTRRPRSCARRVKKLEAECQAEEGRAGRAADEEVKAAWPQRARRKIDCPRRPGGSCTPRSASCRGARRSPGHQPARHAVVETSAPARRDGRRGRSPKARTRVGSSMDWMRRPDNPVLRQGDRQPRLGALLRPRPHRSARQPVAVQPALASRIARRTVSTASSSSGYDLHWLHRDDPAQPHLSAEQHASGDSESTGPTTPTSPAAGCRPRCWSTR